MNIHPGNQYFVLNTHTSGKILWIIIFLTFITSTVFQIIYVQLYSFTKQFLVPQIIIYGNVQVVKWESLNSLQTIFWKRLCKANENLQNTVRNLGSIFLLYRYCRLTVQLKQLWSKIAMQCSLVDLHGYPTCNLSFLCIHTRI